MKHKPFSFPPKRSRVKSAPDKQTESEMTRAAKLALTKMMLKSAR